MTSENVSESRAVETVKAVSMKAVDDQLIDELVHRAQAEGLQLTGLACVDRLCSDEVVGTALQSVGYAHQAELAAAPGRRPATSQTQCVRCGRPDRRPRPRPRVRCR